MRDVIRGYAAAVLEALPDNGVRDVLDALTPFADAVGANVDLARSLGDEAVPVLARVGIVNDLLAPGPVAARRLAVFAVRADAATELAADLGWLTFRVGEELPRRRGEPDPDPAAGHQGVNERLHGYALALLEQLRDEQAIDEVEDQLFRLARTLEAERPLNDTLTNFDLPAAVRDGVVVDLLQGRAEPVTVALIRYAVRQNRGQLVGHLDWLAERVAEERGRRNAVVSSAVELTAEQTDRLVAALATLTGRRVSLQVTVDPGLIGGLRVVVGDTVLDGTVRRRLQQVGTLLVHGTRQRSGGEERPN